MAITGFPLAYARPVWIAIPKGERQKLTNGFQISFSNCSNFEMDDRKKLLLVAFSSSDFVSFQIQLLKILFIGNFAASISKSFL
jgi:hypothetical protein